MNLRFDAGMEVEAFAEAVLNFGVNVVEM